MKTKTLILTALLLCTATVHAEKQWSDVTSLYLTNATFDNGNSGWKKEGSCNSYGVVDYGCMEFWNGYFNVYQRLSGLQKGHYRLSVQAFYRNGDFEPAYANYTAVDEEDIPAMLYVQQGESRTVIPVVSIFSESFLPDWMWGDQWWSPSNEGPYYPNRMVTASECFGYDSYWNTLEFDVDDGELQLGIFCDQYTHSNWCIFDNFRLEHFTDPTETVLAEGLELSATATTLKPSMTAVLTPRFTPANTTLQRVTWATSNPMVATVNDDGFVLARNPGQADISASTVDGSQITASITITVEEESVEPDLRDWTDVTDIYLTNTTFDDNTNTGWIIDNNGNHNMNYQCLEFWNNDRFDMRQHLSGMPRGTYRFSFQGFHRYGSPQADYEQYQQNLPTSRAFVYAVSGHGSAADVEREEQKQPVCEYLSSWIDYDTWSETSSGDFWNIWQTWYFPNTMWSSNLVFERGGYQNAFEFSGEGDMTLGVALSEYTSENWFICDNFRLEFLGEVIEPTGAAVQFGADGSNRVEMKAGETLQCYYTVTPQGAMVKGVRWESSDTKVATITDDGLLTAVGSGTSYIRLILTKPDDTTFTVRGKVTVLRDELKPGDIVINEIMAANIDEYVSPAFNFDAWMELYNSTSQDIDLVGYYLSDDASNLTKWRLPAKVGKVPAKGHLTIWFDSNNIAQQNAPFKLDIDGGTIFLSDDKGALYTSQDYPAAIGRTSYARTTDGGSQWAVSSTPTPGATNAGASFATQQLEAPVVDLPSQLFTGQLSVNVGIPAGCTLRYTTDGTLPTLTNGETSRTGQFAVDKTTSLRLRLFANGMLPSPVTTRSYILSIRDYTLPVISVVTDPTFLYSSEIGVFETGPNGRPGNGRSDNCNWNMDWERPVNFSFITQQGDMVLNQDVDLEMCGGWSRAWSPRAFKLKGNKELSGSKNLPYPFFTKKPYIRNRTLQIRNGGNDNNCRFKDPALATMVQTANIDIDLQSYEPVHEFINGNYMGVLNMREPNNKHFVYANYGWDDDEIDQFEMSPDSGYVQKCGTPDAFEQLVSLSEDAALSETYAEICRLLDIDEYINYMAAEFYLGGNDWPQNNVKGFRHRDNGKFRFVLFDLDFAFRTSDPFRTFMDKETYRFDQLYPTSLGRITAPIKFVTLFRNLLQNATFRKKFVDAYTIMGGSVFEASRANDIIDQLASVAEPAMQLKGESVYPSANELRNGLKSRLSTATYALMDYSPFELADANPRRVRLTADAPGTQLYINDMPVPTEQFYGNIFPPATLRAEAPAGYVFQGWKNSSGGTDIIGEGATWLYSDSRSLDGENWKALAYDTSSWYAGPAPFGYGKDDIATEVDYWRYWGEKQPTIYFRNTFNLATAPQSSETYRLDFTVDDGAIIYVNGTEAARYNMPSGNVTYNTFAATYASGNPDHSSIEIPTRLLHRGNNVIAVELHNHNSESTDMYWDAQLVKISKTTGSDNFLSTEAEITLPDAGGTISLIAVCRALTPAERAAQGITPVRINEVSASNDSYINEYGKKGDWVELYNTTDEAIDLDGAYLSDNPEKPLKEKLTKAANGASTVIPAHGRLIVWCDKQPTTASALHTQFKLSSEGGSLILTAADRSWQDVLTYPAHDARTTVGRFPDGTATVCTMPATIAAANLLTSYAQRAEQGGVSPNAVDATIAAANGLRISYGAQTLFVKSDDAHSATVEIFTTDGRLVHSQAVSLAKGTARLDVASLPSGFYVARATTGHDTSVGCKFMK